MFNFCLKIVALVAGISFFGLAVAEERHLLTHPGETAHFNFSGTSAIVFYDVASDGLSVTTLLTDNDGETLRSRVVLSDGQAHVITLSGDEINEWQLHFGVRRLENRIEISAIRTDDSTKLAAR